MAKLNDLSGVCPLVTSNGPREAKKLEQWELIDDSSEEEVTVPHTWNDEDSIDPSVEYYRGQKRYQRKLEPLSDDRNRCLLHFEAANQRTEVRVDGSLVGTHEGGYTAFTFDITDFLSDSESVSLEVLVDNSHNPEIPPLSMDYTFFGGIYRPVWRVETSDVAIDGCEYGSTGVLVDSPSLSENEAVIRTRTNITNDRSTGVLAEITHRVVDETGNIISEFGTRKQLDSNERQSVEILCDPIENPKLWSPETPYCYTVESIVTVDGETTDRVDSTLGIKEVETDEEGQIRINGEPIELRGTNRHQDKLGMGNALSIQDHKDDFNRIADLDVNFLRLAHYPQSEVMLQSADMEGIVIWEEIPVVNYVTDSVAHDENCRRMLREMIHQHYNHPSVSIWGIMNEILLHFAQEHIEGPTEKEVKSALNLADDLNKIAHDEDPNRLTAMACHHDWAYEKYGFVDIPDVLGWNLYHGWYLGEPEHIGGVLHEKISARPTQPTIVSEYGAGADPRLHASDPTAWDFTEEYSNRLHEIYIKEFDNNGTSLAGTAQWNIFDFASDLRDDTIPDINQKGLMTYDRTPKSTYHLYKAWLSDEPFVHIATRNWKQRSSVSAASEAGHLVTVFTNLSEVELFANGRPQGSKEVEEGYALHWNVSLTEGTNEIRTRATDAGGTVVEDIVDIELVTMDVDMDGTFPKEGLSINVGSDVEILADDSLWVPDQSYEAISTGWGAIGGERISTLDRIYATDLVPLYQHALNDLDAYQIDVPPGTYSLELGFCEIEHESSGQRIVSVMSNGETIIDGVDPFASAGRREPVVLSTDIDIESGGLTLEFEAENGDPLLNTISIREKR